MTTRAVENGVETAGRVPVSASTLYWRFWMEKQKRGKPTQARLYLQYFKVCFAENLTEDGYKKVGLRV